MPNNSGKYFGNGPLNTEIQKWPCIHKAELWQWQWPNRITCTELPYLAFQPCISVASEPWISAPIGRNPHSSRGHTVRTLGHASIDQWTY